MEILAVIVLMMGEISDAINNPIVGVFSNRIYSPWGRHLPSILGEILPFTLLYDLHWPSVHSSDNVTINQ